MTDDVGALDALAIESLGPLDEDGLGEPLLLQGEGEGEAQGEDLGLQLSVVHKVGETPARARKMMDSVLWIRIRICKDPNHFGILDLHGDPQQIKIRICIKIYELDPET